MNKYQEALNKISEVLQWQYMGKRSGGKTLIQNSINTLQEAVDKANKYDDKETTFVIVDQFGIVKCGNCKEPITHPKYGSAKYCLHCGQALDKE